MNLGVSLIMSGQQRGEKYVEISPLIFIDVFYIYMCTNAYMCTCTWHQVWLCLLIQVGTLGSSNGEMNEYFRRKLDILIIR